MIQPLLFAIVTAAALYVAGRNFLKIRLNILLGKDEPTTGDAAVRWRNVMLIAFGQKKMFARPIPAIFHFFIYAAFLLTQIELIEIFVDGFKGSHRIFSGALGGFYTFIIGLIEALSVLAFVATVIFLLRRNVLKINRFQNSEMKGWPSKDANLILFGEILLLTGIFSMNGADTVLQSMGAEHYPRTGPFLVSSTLGPALFGGMSEGALVAIERFGWWLHILTVYGFLIYLSVSKHLHIILAFPNTFYARINPRGEVANMPEIQKEVASMMNPEAAPTEPQPEVELSFGANDVTKLRWQDLLAAYTCTECGRCTSVCPANITGKKLSPRKIMMDVRDRCEEVGRTMDAQKSATPIEDGKTLFDYISREEIHACTTCNACVEACPVLINPLDIILQLRRHEILMESAGPSDWLPLFNSLENSQAAWAVSTERDGWKNQLAV
jgi:heterodisulfide reductase subunit C